METFTPWRREPKEAPDSTDLSELENWNPKYRMFDVYPQNMHLDIYAKRAALTASPSVVGLESHFGEGVILQRSGFIIESGSTHSVILTSACLLNCCTSQCLLNCCTSQNFKADDIKVTVYLLDGRSFHGEILAKDVHYNIAAIRIHTNVLLPTISLAQLKDGIAVNPSLQVNEESCRRPHSNAFELVPGDLVIALGRFIKTCDIMAAPGLFSIGHCMYDCKELFKTSCRITECGVGGPIINRFGEAIGISFHDYCYTAFLPINIASIWWEHCKKHGQPRRPLLGMQVTNLYALPVQIIEGIIGRFPDIVNGVVVEEVVPRSAADSAGIKHNDVIVEFAGKRVHSVLELFENTLNKAGEPVQLTLIRASRGVRLQLNMVVDEGTSG